MLYPMLITATLAAFLAGGLCYLAKIKNSFAVLGIQFVVSFIITYGVSYYLARDVYKNSTIAITCAAISLVIFFTELVLRRTIGPLDSREPGTIGKNLDKNASSGTNRISTHPR